MKIPRLKRLDAYILQMFFISLLSSMVVVAMLYVILDFFQNIPDILECFSRLGAAATFMLIFRYYASQMALYFSSFAEIVAVVPALLVASSMAKSNELIAPIAGGVSLRRIVAPLVIACGLVGLGGFAVSNIYGSELSRKIFLDKRVIFDSADTFGESLSVQGFIKGRSELLSVKSFDSASRTGTGFAAEIIEPDKPFVDIRAPLAVWEGESREWQFPEGATRYEYGGESAKIAEIKSHPTQLSASILEAEELGTQMLSLGALWAQRDRPRFARALHHRFVLCLAPFILAMCVLPLVLLMDRTKVFAGMSVAFITLVLFEVATRAINFDSYVILSSYTAPAIFVALGIWRVSKLET